MKTELLSLYIRPGSTRTKIDGLYMDRIKIRISSPPEKNRANDEIKRLLSDILDIPKKNIILERGKKSPYKDFAIKSDKNIEEIKDALLGSN